MQFPREQDLIDERRAVLATLDELDDAQFDHGLTLCEGWAPRDVLAHLIGVDDALVEYPKALGRINVANARIVERSRALPRDEIMGRARAWAEQPSLTTRMGAWWLLGDVAVHHRDIARGMGLDRPVSLAARDAILREGILLGARRLATHRVVPTDGGKAVGRGTVVRGSTEALGLWLCGRQGVDAELTFVQG